MTEDLTRGSGELSHQAEQTTTENGAELSASAASETLSGQATTSVTPPPAGQTVVFQPQAGDRFALNANPADVRILVEGNDLILAFDTNGDGTPDSSAVFENLVNVAQGDNPPVVVVGNQPIAANVLIGGVLALAGEEATVETAADAGAEGTGGTQYNDDLGDVINLLVAQGIIPPTELQFGLIERIDPTAIDLAEGELTVRFETEIHGRTFGGGFEDGQPFQNICKPGVYPMQIVVEFDPNDNETLEVLKISGFPKGSVILVGGSDPLDPNVKIIDVASEPFELVLTDGEGHFVFDGTNWIVKGGLFMLPPPDADNDIPLHFEATIEDPDSGDTDTLNVDTTAIIDAVADKPAAWFEGKGIFQVDGPELHKMDFGYGKANFGDAYYQENGLKLIADYGDEFHIANFTGSGPIWWGERELKIGDGDLEDAYVLCPKYDDCLNLISLDLQDCTTTDLVFISSEGAVFVIPAGSEPGSYHFPDGFQNVDFVKFYGEELDGKNASVIDNIKFSLACDCEPKEFKVCYLEDNAHPDGCRDGCLTDGDPKYAIGAKFKVTDHDGSEGITKLTFCLEDKIDNDGQIHAPWVPDGNNVDDIEALGPYGESTTFMSIGGDKVTEGEVFCLWAKVFNASEGEIQGIGAGEFGWAKVEATAHFLYGKLVLDFEQDCNDGLHIQSVSLTHGQLLEVHLPQHADDDFTVKATVKVEENPTDEELVEWNNSSKQTTEIDVIVKAVADGAEISFKDYTKGKECERHDLDLRKGGLYATWGEDITVTAFDKHGDPAKVFFDHGTGIGVVSFGDGGSGGRFDEINSVGNDKSEGLCFEFDSPVTDAKFELSAFYKGEPGVGNEQGEWTAYLNGCEVGSDCFTANRSDGDFELQLPDDLVFDKIVFTAKPGTSDGQEGDSSDYYVQKVCYEELLPGLCYFEETTTEGECCDEIPLLKLDWAEDGEGSPKDHGANCDEDSLIVPVKFQAALIDEDGSESVTKVKLSLCEADCNAEWVNKWGNELCEGDTVWFDNGFKGKVVYIDGDDLVISFDYDQSANNGKDFCLDGEIGVKLPIDDSNDFQIKIGVTTSETHDDNWGAGDKSCTTEAIIDVDVKGVVGPAKTSFGDYAECRECHRSDAYVDQRDPSKGHWGNDITVKVYDKNGYPATLFVGSDGLGVVSGNDGGSGNRFNEINYVGHGKSESMELCFDFPVTDVKFELSAFYKNEGGVGDEQGEWTAYLHGEEVGEGCFTADSSSGSYELELGHLTFDKIVFKALPGTYDYPDDDSSDYYIEKVCYEKPIDGLCEVSTTEKWVDGKKVDALKLVWAEDGEGNPSEHGPNACEDPLCIPIQFKAETQDDDGSQKSEAITKIVLEENSCGEFVVKGECDGQVQIWAEDQLGCGFWAVATVTHYDGKLILEFEDIDCVPQLVNKVDLGGVVDVKLAVDDSNDFCVEIKTTTREYDDDNFDKDGNWTGYDYDAEVKVAETSVKDYIDIEIKGVVGPAATSFNYDECKVCADEVYLSDNAKTGLWGHDIKIAAFDKYGNPAKIVDSAHGLGVESNNDGGSDGRYDEINYDDVANKSESLVLDFCGKVTGVKVELSAFYKNEGGVGDERGQYELYLNGEKVGEGCFEANSGSGDYCLDLGDACFDKIVFKGREGDEDSYDGDSSDYYVKEVCYTPVYEGLCEVGEGECLVDCPIEVDAQVVDGGGNYEFGLYLQSPPLGDHLADTVILVHLPPGYSVAEGHGTHSLWNPETNIVEFRADQLIGQGRLNWTIQLNGPCEPNPDDFLIETFNSVPALQTTWAEDGTADPCDHGANACEDPLCIPVEFRAKTQDDDGKQQSEAITKIVLHEDGDGHFVVEGCNDGKLEILAIGLDGEAFTAIAHVSQYDGKLVLEFKDIYGKPQLVQEVDLSCAVKLVHPIDDSTDYCLKIETTTTEYDDDSFYGNGSWKSYVGDDDVKVEEFTKTDMLSVEIKGVVGKAIVQLKGERTFFEDGGEICKTETQCPEDICLLGKGKGTWGPDIEIFGYDENGNHTNLHVDGDGVGVASSNDGGSGVRFDELQHTGEGVFGTESIVLKFDCPVSGAKVELSEFFSNENGVGDEQGGWIAFLDGDYVGSDVFTANSGGGDFCLDLGNLIFDKMLFVGVQGTNDPDGVGNSNSDSSDYNIKSVTYGKVVCCQDPEDGPLKLPVEVCVATQDTDASEGVLAINLVLGGCEQETLRGFQFLGSNCQPVCEGDTFEAKGYTYDDYGCLTGETCITLEACAIEGGWLLKVVPDHNTPFDGWDKIVLNEGEIFIQPPQHFNGDFDLTISGHLKEFDDDLDGGKYGKDIKVTEETVTYKVVPLNDKPEADPVKTEADEVPAELDDKFGDVVLFKALDVGGGLDGTEKEPTAGEPNDPADLGGEDVETPEGNLVFEITTLPSLGSVWIDYDGNDATGGDWVQAAIGTQFDTGDKLYWLANLNDAANEQSGPGSVTFNYKVIDDGSGCEDCASDPAPVQICYELDLIDPPTIDIREDDTCIDEDGNNTVTFAAAFDGDPNSFPAKVLINLGALDGFPIAEGNVNVDGEWRVSYSGEGAIASVFQDGGNWFVSIDGFTDQNADGTLTFYPPTNHHEDIGDISAVAQQTAGGTTLESLPDTACVAVNAIADTPTEVSAEVSSVGGLAYAIGGAEQGGNTSTLYKIDLATGDATVVGVVDANGPGASGDNLDVEAMAFNPEDGFLYALVKTPGNLAGLIRVNPETAATVFIGGNLDDLTNDPAGFAFDTSGGGSPVLYGAIKEGGDTNLYTVDLSTGDATLIGEIEDGGDGKDISGLAIDDAGQIYGVGKEGNATKLYSIDKTTGDVTATVDVTGSAIDTNTDIENLSFDGSGNLWAIDRISGETFKIDPATGAAVLISTTDANNDQTSDGFENLAIVACGDAQTEGTVTLTLKGSFGDLDGSEDHYFLVKLPDGWPSESGEITDPAGVPAGRYLKVDVADNEAEVETTVDLTAPDSEGDFSFDIYAVAQEAGLPSGEGGPTGVFDDDCEDCENPGDNLAVSQATTVRVDICDPNEPRNFLPDAVDDDNTVSESTSDETVNIMVVFDRSGSMGDDPNVDGFSDRIDLARAAVANMLHVAGQQYSAVNVLVVDFAGSADNSGWTSIDGANSYLTLLDPSGNTDYQDAIAEATAAFNSGTPAADRNLTFFLSDGNPDPSNLQLTAGQQGDWEDFLAANGMPAYAIGVGTGVTEAGLDPVAHDPDGGPADDPIILTDEGDLIPTLVNILGAVVDGNLLANDSFGGDGQPLPPAPAITQVLYNNAASSGFGSAFTTAAVVGAGIVTITGSIGGDDHWVLTVDTEGTDAGDYELTVLRDLPQAVAGGTGHLVFDYTIQDGNGDTDVAQLDIGVIDATETVNQLELIAGTDGNDWDLPPFFFGTDLAGDGNAEILGGDNGSDHLLGSGAGDFLYGGNDGDRLEGGAGDDYLVGGAGNDKLFGDAGNDAMNGGFGDDELNGGDGNDLLDGGTGDNVLNGDAGDDTLVWESSGDEYDGGDDFDTLVISGGDDIEVDGDLVDNIADIEAIDMRNGLENDLGDGESISAADVISMTDGDDELFILGDAGGGVIDSVDLDNGSGFVQGANAIPLTGPFAGIEFTSWSVGGVTVFIEDGLSVSN